MENEKKYAIIEAAGLEKELTEFHENAKTLLKDTKNTFFRLGVASTLALSTITGMVAYDQLPRLKKEHVKNLKPYDLNKDGLMDLEDSDGNFYLQTKDGKFVPYIDMLEQEEARVKELYKIKRDSTANVPKSKLEKEVLEK